ncbi:MAG TPA: DNA helicase UvrD [Verrucomicrobiales bacterium]|nr:DNA helicase UvrD [Verrucomicrobiales bacterium]
MPRDYVLKQFSVPVDLSIDYAAELNPQQHAAVTAPPGPALVIAGAGSGKTRTLTYRVAYLLEQGIPADRILLLTFTNKAAREMMRRVAELLGRELRELWGGTFHSIGARVLRRHAEAVGYRPDFTILDREDAVDLIKTCITAAEIDPKKERFPKADALQDVFSMAVNRRKTVAELLAEDYEHFARLAPTIERVANLYRERKQAANVMDFDDLLVLWLRLLEGDESIRGHYQRKLQFVLVDEYQDTNQIQSDLIELLAERSGNLMVVGDDSQSIYSWRGANFRNILDFPKRHPKAVVYKIETNYRSTPQILDVANAAIAANLEQFAKQLTPAQPAGGLPVVVACSDAQQQAAFVAQRMLELREEGGDLKQMAVLYRSHFHALELQLELTRRNIPFSITSGIRFFEQAHIKDVAAYVKFVTNPDDELSFKRLVLMLPGIGGKGAERLWSRFREAGEGPRTIAPRMMVISRGVPKKAEAAWAQLAATLSQLEAEDVRTRPADMIELVIEAGYDEYLKQNHTNWRQRLDDLQQLASFALQFSDTTEFLTQLSLLTNIEAEAEAGAARAADDERVRLSTIHQAKGLEFDVVFVIMLCDGLFPSERSLGAAAGEEEERRLFYVAVTRARRELYLSYPLMRSMAGYGGEAFQSRSRFLGEIPTKLVEEWNLRTF